MDQNPAVYRQCIDWNLYMRQYHKEIKDFMDQNPVLFHNPRTDWKKFLRVHQSEVASFQRLKYPNISARPESFCHQEYNWSEGAFLYFSQNPRLHPVNLPKKKDYNGLYGIDYDSFDARQYALDTGRSVKTPKYMLINYAYHEKYEQSEMSPYARVIQPPVSPAPISGDLTSHRGSFLGSLESKLGDQDSIILD
jgi:hypothetical protein